MTDVALNETALHRWRSDPLSFIEEVLHDPETGKPFVLLEAERAFMRRAFALDADGRLAVLWRAQEERQDHAPSPPPMRNTRGLLASVGADDAPIPGTIRAGEDRGAIGEYPRERAD